MTASDFCERCGRHPVECGCEPDIAMIEHAPTRVHTRSIMHRGVAIDLKDGQTADDARAKLDAYLSKHGLDERFPLRERRR